MGYRTSIAQNMEECYRDDPQKPGTTKVSCSNVYTVDGLIGSGFNGKIFSATRKEDGMKVAIKRFTACRMATDGCLPIEVAALRALAGVPGVIQYHDYFSDGYCHLLVMERPEYSIDLEKFIQVYGLLPEKLVKSIFKQLVEAFASSAKKNVYHQDLKTVNFMLSLQTCEVILIDYGIAGIMEDVEMKTCNFGSVIHGCKPPEWKGAARVKPSEVMVWMLGRQLYTLLTNDDRLEDDDMVYEKPQWPNGVPIAARRLVMQCLNVNPKKRPTLGAILCDRWLKDALVLPFNVESLLNIEQLEQLHELMKPNACFDDADSEGAYCGSDDEYSSSDSEYDSLRALWLMRSSETDDEYSSSDSEYDSLRPLWLMRFSETRFRGTEKLGQRKGASMAFN